MRACLRILSLWSRHPKLRVLVQTNWPAQWPRIPLIYQELPYNPKYTIYNRRLAAVEMDNYTADEVYWAVRRQVIMRHTGELPLEICGPDAEKLLNLLFTRNISKVKVGRCSYQ